MTGRASPQRPRWVTAHNDAVTSPSLPANDPSSSDEATTTDAAADAAVVGLRLEDRGTARVLHVRGDIDLVAAPSLAEAFSGAAVDQTMILVVDLTEVTFLGSAGLGVLLKARREVGPGQLRIVAARATLRPIDLTGLSRIFTVYRTLDAALADTAATTTDDTDHHEQ